jgi:hypothetical protein
MKGFLGTWASFSADLNLLIQIAMGIALLAGAFLARAKHYRAHGICQTVVLILNLPMIALECCQNSLGISGNDTTPSPWLTVFWEL